MSTFKYHRNTKHRYNTYESHSEIIEIVVPKIFYPKIRNILFFIALILSLLFTIFVSFPAYENQENKYFKTLMVNNNLENRNKITKSEITQAISEGIIQKIDSDNSFENIDNKQLKRIIKNVIKKVKRSHHNNFYTKNKDFHVLQFK